MKVAPDHVSDLFDFVTAPDPGDDASAGAANTAMAVKRTANATSLRLELI
jgi:hypothetical protein